MRPELVRIGTGRSPVVVIDDFSGDLEPILDIAEALAPFPFHAANYYPGLRRLIAEEDEDANAYIERTLEAAAPFIGGAFECDGFDLLEASFSMVTAGPDTLQPAQRAPHFDSTDPNYLAVLHYLNVEPGTGTAFYRQRSTGIERVTEANAAAFIGTAQRESAQLPPGSGYIQGSDAFFEQTHAIEARPDRMIIYQGYLLHSGIIPETMTLSGHPRAGRLTANIFVRAH